MAAAGFADRQRDPCLSLAIAREILEEAIPKQNERLRDEGANQHLMHLLRMQGQLLLLLPLMLLLLLLLLSLWVSL